jgi:hypothetical protein
MLMTGQLNNANVAEVELARKMLGLQQSIIVLEERIDCLNNILAIPLSQAQLDSVDMARQREVLLQLQNDKLGLNDQLLEIKRILNMAENAVLPPDGLVQYFTLRNKVKTVKDQLRIRLTEKRFENDFRSRNLGRYKNIANGK